jgi:circadian clock protein KaiC
MNDKAHIRRLPSGVPGLDEVFGGGIPEFSFNLIAGPPGSGKTTLAHQIMFALASPERRAIFFTVLGEPPFKMLRYQQQFSFFDVDKVNDSVRFLNLGEELQNGGLAAVLSRIIQEVEATSPAIVVVDSFRSIAQAATRADADALHLQDFVQELGVRLTGWQATTFLVGEYQPSEREENPVFTVADGLLWHYQSLDRDSMVRKMQVMKMRGQAPIPGLHTFRITDHGVQVFPRMIVSAGVQQPDDARRPAAVRLSTGVQPLDRMLGGGVPARSSVLVTGPSGSGKTVLATRFIEAGVEAGEPGVIAVFEKRPVDYSQVVSRSFEGFVRDGRIGVLQTRPLDLSIDETLYELTAMIQRLKAKRVVIDSLSGFELALAPTFREDFRESLYRMVTLLTGLGVTVLMTAELEDSYTDLRFSPHGTAFLTDVIILQRYVELSGQFRRMMAVVKVRGSAHSHDLHLYDITDEGIAIGEMLESFAGLLTGSPEPSSGRSPRKRAGRTR